jgi:hypothetical protein
VLTAIGQGATPPTTFTNEMPPEGKVGEPYSFQLATDAQPRATYAITSGAPPERLTLVL